jgi:hypothetical protein
MSLKRGDNINHQPKGKTNYEQPNYKIRIPAAVPGIGLGQRSFTGATAEDRGPVHGLV